MGVIFDTCILLGYNKNWQKQCDALAKNKSKRLRNQEKVNSANSYLEGQKYSVDRLDLAALVSSTQSGGDIDGTNFGNQFCEDKSIQFPFISLLPNDFHKGQLPEIIGNAYKDIQANANAVTIALPKGASPESTHLYPSGKDVECAIGLLGQGESSIIEVLDQIEKTCQQNGRILPNDWREKTMENIEKWQKVK